MFETILRGEIYITDLNPFIGSEQGFLRPCLIISNDIGNRFSSTAIIAPITSRPMNDKLPVHVALSNRHFLSENSHVLLEQIRAVDKQRIKRYVGRLTDEEMKPVNAAIMLSCGIEGYYEYKQ